MATHKTVRQLLNEKGHRVLTAAPDDTVYAALERMADADVGSVVVVEGGRGRLLGIFTERDYARKVILRGRSSRDTRLREVMTGDLVTVEPTTTVHACLGLMTERRVRHLPVLDAGAMVGLVSIGDAVKSIISEQEFLIEQLQSYIGGGFGGGFGGSPHG